ncbi:MAG: hypothetical protein RL464_418, partial [Actinomycetota bacterium]
MFSKFLRKSGIKFVSLLLISGCSIPSNPLVDTTARPELERNILTGEVGKNGKVIAIKFDDTRAA